MRMIAMKRNDQTSGPQRDDLISSSIALGSFPTRGPLRVARARSIWPAPTFF
jgi:hypothetical protein